MKTPIIQTKRLLLRPMTVEDAQTAFTNWTGDPKVAKFMRWECHTDVAQTKAWLLLEQEMLESDTVYNWGFVLKDTGMLIGSGGLVYNQAEGMYELGYNIMHKYWGQGLATEAARYIIDFGIKELGQKVFYCCHAVDNPASGSVMQKVGFRYRKDGVYDSWDKTRSFPCEEYLLQIP